MLRIHEVAAVVVATSVLLTVFATWVIRSVGDAAPPLETTRSAPQVSPSESARATSNEPARLGPFREAFSKSRTILVIGDSSGDERGEWVNLWSQDLATNRKVTYHQWDSDAGFTASPKVYGTSKDFGSDKPIAIWNLSYLGVEADYAQNLIDVPATPDAVIISVGHDRDLKALDRAIGSTIDAVDERWGEVPVALVLQNPSTGSEARSQEAAVFHVRSLATKYGVPVIDAHAAFLEAGDLENLLLDGRRPNERGSRVWADAVTAALTD